MNFWKDKKVLITGHTGFKGATLCKLLLEKGAYITGYSLEPPTMPNLFDIYRLSKEPNLRSFKGDIRNLMYLEEIIQKVKPEIIFHLAAQPIVRKSYEEPVYTYETNVIGTLNVLEAVRHSDAIRSAVIVTTDKVYLNEENEEKTFREEEKLCGNDPYSNSKSCAELVTFSYKKSFFQYRDSPAISTARAGNVIGYGDFAKDRIIPDCIRAASKEELVKVRNPNSIRPYQHVTDCLSGYLMLAEKQFEDKEKYSGSYNFGPQDEDCITTGKLVNLFYKYWNEERVSRGKAKLTNLSVPETVKEIIKKPCIEIMQTREGEEAPHEAKFLRLDSSKARDILGWKPTMNIETAVAKTVKEFFVYV